MVVEVVVVVLVVGGGTHSQATYLGSFPGPNKPISFVSRYATKVIAAVALLLPT